MRNKGKITSWNDEREFGFITPDNDSRQIFVHINSFKNREKQPKIGQKVNYIISYDIKGRRHAINVLFSDKQRNMSIGSSNINLNQAADYSDSKERPHSANVLLADEWSKSGGIGSSVMAILFLITVAVTSFHLNKIPRLIFWVYLFASLLAFLMYAKDKSAAKKGSWRTPESTLHLLSLLCGWPGALIAQQTLRHKSKKPSFRFVFWVTVVLNCGAFSLLFIPEVAVEVQYWLDIKLKFWFDNIAKPFILMLLKKSAI